MPPEWADQVAATLSAGHFLCHVFHLDYVLKKGAEVAGPYASLADGAHTFAVTNFYHRRLRPLGGGATGDVDLPVPSQINTDVGAHPCL